MYNTIWDRLAAWLAECTAGEQLMIILAAGITVFTMLLWVTI
jgi:hypothetical protein